MHVTEEHRQESIKKVVEEFIASEEGGEGRTPSAPASRSPLLSDPPRHAAPSAPLKDVESAAASLAGAEAEIDVIESDIALLDENGKVVAEEIDVSVKVSEKATVVSDEKDESEESGSASVDGASPGQKAADAQSVPESPCSDVETAASCSIDAEGKIDEKRQDGKRAEEHVSDGTPIDFELITYSDLKGITYEKGGSAKKKSYRAGDGLSSSELLREIEELSSRNTVLLVATNDRSEYIADTTVVCGSFSKEGETSPWDALALREFLASARDSDSPSITAIYYTEKDDRNPIRYSCLSKRAKGKWVFDDHKWARRHLVDSLAAMGLWWIMSSLKYKKKIC